MKLLQQNEHLLKKLKIVASTKQFDVCNYSKQWQKLTSCEKVTIWWFNCVIIKPQQILKCKTNNCILYFDENHVSLFTF